MRSAAIIQPIRKYLLAFATAFFFVLMLRITLPYLGFRYDVGFLLTKQGVLYHTLWRYSFYIHICTSLFVLLFGGFQFINTQRITLHRALGKWYVGIVLLAAAPSGLVLGFYANGGRWAQVAFMLAAVLWWLTTLNAFLSIRKGDVDTHRRMMYYSYAFTLSAISLRTYALVFPFFFHLPPNQMYTLIAWMGWAPNLVIAHVLLWRRSALSRRLDDLPIAADRIRY